MGEDILPADPPSNWPAEVRRALATGLLGRRPTGQPPILRALSRHTGTHPGLFVLGCALTGGLGGFVIGAVGYGYGTLLRGAVVGGVMFVVGAVRGVRAVRATRRRSGG